MLFLLIPSGITHARMEASCPKGIGMSLLAILEESPNHSSNTITAKKKKARESLVALKAEI
jgi:hypothetical protein